MTNMLTQQQLNQIVRTKEDMYECCERNQYIMPPLKDAICTKEFLMGVKDKKIWCLNSSDVKGYKVCASKPTCEQLSKILSQKLANYKTNDQQLATAMLKTALLIRKKPPSKNWQLLMMSFICPDHEVFSKDYVRPAHNEDDIILQNANINNPDEFFNNIPFSKSQKKQYTIADTEYKQHMKMVRLKKNVLKGEQRIKKELERVEKLNAKKLEKERQEQLLIKELRGEEHCQKNMTTQILQGVTQMNLNAALDSQNYSLDSQNPLFQDPLKVDSSYSKGNMLPNIIMNEEELKFEAKSQQEIKRPQIQFSALQQTKLDNQSLYSQSFMQSIHKSQDKTKEPPVLNSIAKQTKARNQKKRAMQKEYNITQTQSPFQ